MNFNAGYWLRRRRPLLAAALIVGACVLAFWPGMPASLHLDDYDILRNNALASRGMVDLVRLYPTRWLVVLSLWANARLQGEAVFGYHAVNLALHCVNAWLVCLLTWRLWWWARRRGWRLRGVAPHGLGVFVALVFAVHPLQTQAVVYITQRFTLAASVFYLLALAAVVQAYRPGRAHWRGWWWAGIATALGALCKEIIVTAPLLATSAVWCWIAPLPWRRWRARTWALVAGLLLLAGALPALYFAHLSHWDAHTLRYNLQAIGGPITMHYPALTRTTYLLTQPRVLVRYLALLVWPQPLSIDHAVRISTAWHEPALLAACGVLLAALLAAWRGRRMAPWCWWGALFFFIPLLPQSSIMPAPDVMFEHRTYLSVAGFGWCLGGLLCLAVARARTTLLRRLVYGGMLLYLVVLVLATRQRCAVWRDELTLWRDAYAQAPAKQRVVVNYANALFERGAVDETIACLTAFIRTTTTIWPHTSALLGNALAARGALDAALGCYAQAVHAQVANDQWRYNYALLLHRAGRLREAQQEASWAVYFNPWNADAWYLSGSLCAQTSNDYVTATNHLTRSLQLTPDGPHAHDARRHIARIRAALAPAPAPAPAATTREKEPRP
jgi:hypothetical protein